MVKSNCISLILNLCSRGGILASNLLAENSVISGLWSMWMMNLVPVMNSAIRSQDHVTAKPSSPLVHISVPLLIVSERHKMLAALCRRFAIA